MLLSHTMISFKIFTLLASSGCASFQLQSFGSSLSPPRTKRRHSLFGNTPPTTTTTTTTRWRSMPTDTIFDATDINSSVESAVDRRPHEQRVSGPRKARRLNNQFQYLFRHSDPRWADSDWKDDDIHVLDEISTFYDARVSNTQRLQDGGYHASHQQHPQINTTIARRRIGLLAIQYLHQYGGYSLDEIYQMHRDFPPLLEMNVASHFRPKLRFLIDCLGGASSTDDRLLNPKLKAILPANFYGSRLERTIAPRHAFLVHVGLPSGKALWDYTYETRQLHNHGGSGTSITLLEQFLLMHRKPKQFAAMCNKWRELYGLEFDHDDHRGPITSEEITAFDKLFQRGLLSAARDDCDYVFPDECSGQYDDNNNDNNQLVNVNRISPSLLKTANVTSAQLIRYLIQHGSNPWYTDVRGASLFHWAAGCGNLDGLQELVHGCNMIQYAPHDEGDYGFTGTDSSNPGVHAALLWKANRDDATPLHWAAAGAGPKEFGVGGHISVCNYLLSLCTEHTMLPERMLVNSQTKDGNTVLMWAAWSRSLDIVKFLVRNRTDATTTNRNGCSVAHWASSGGDLSVCKYLHEMANVDFTTENHAGNTPLSHAVAYGRYEVVQWLKDELNVEDSGRSAENLAMDFVNWADMGVGLIAAEDEVERRRVYSLFNSFEDWAKEDQEI